MDLTQIPIGKNAPQEINVIIEVPQGVNPVKYELDKDSGAVFVDRFLHTAMYYPCNYGFAPETLSDDGDPTDVLVVSRNPVVPGSVMKARPIGVLMMEDEKGVDEKLLAVPVTKLDPYYEDVKDYTDIPQILRDQIQHFFEHYKDLEKGKWVKVTGWKDRAEAEAIISQNIEMAKK